MSKLALFVACGLLYAGASSAGQSQGAPATRPGAAETARRESTAPTPPSGYGYATDGRRDPFLSLIVTGNADSVVAAAAVTRRPTGIAGLMVNEIVVRGIVQTQGQWVAVVGSPDGKTHSVRPGDQLMDGTVSSVTPQALIVMQDVNDSMSLEKRREVRKYLRGGEEVK